MLGAYSEYQQELFSRVRLLREVRRLTFKAIAYALIAEGYKAPRGGLLGAESVFSIYKKGVGRVNRLSASPRLEIRAIEVASFDSINTKRIDLHYRVSPDWEVFEDLKTGQKLEALCQCLNVPFTETSKPWQTLLWLIGFRNDIVHGKPEHVKTQKVLPDIAVEKTRLNHPKSKLETLLTVGNAKRAVQATKDMYEIFRLATPIDVGFEIFQDGWSGSVTALVDENGSEGSNEEVR